MGTQDQPMIHVFSIATNDKVSRMQLMPLPRNMDKVVVFAENQAVLQEFLDLYGAFNIMQAFVSRPTILESVIQILMVLQKNDEEKRAEDIVLHCRMFSKSSLAAIIALEGIASTWYVAFGDITNPLFAKGPTRKFTKEEYAVLRAVGHELKEKNNPSITVLVDRMKGEIEGFSSKRKETQYRWVAKQLKKLEQRGLIELAPGSKDGRTRIIIPV